jgi:hypothetical protein
MDSLYLDVPFQGIFGPPEAEKERTVKTTDKYRERIA